MYEKISKRLVRHCLSKDLTVIIASKIDVPLPKVVNNPAPPNPKTPQTAKS
jgi:hypothetical protein